MRDRDEHSFREELGDDRCDRRDRRRDRHRHGQRVVDQQGRTGHEPRGRTEVVAGDEVAARAVRIGPDRLPVAGGDDREDRADHDRERHREADRTDAGDDEDPHHLLGRIGRRADVVAAEDRERLQLREPLVLLALGADRAADEDRADLAQRARPSRPIEHGPLGGDQLALVTPLEELVIRPDATDVGIAGTPALSRLGDLETRVDSSFRHAPSVTGGSDRQDAQLGCGVLGLDELDLDPGASSRGGSPPGGGGELRAHER